MEQISGAKFCRDFITNNKCWGVNCKYIHGSARDEIQYNRTGLLSEEHAQFWKRSLAFQRTSRNICFDHKQSKCFRVHCKQGRHPMRSSIRLEDMLFVYVYGGPIIQKLYTNLKLKQGPFYVDIYAHKNVPFKYIGEFVKKSLKQSLRTRKMIFTFNGKQVNENRSLEDNSVGNNCFIYVDFVNDFFTENDYDVECSICKEDVNEFIGKAQIEGCRHWFHWECIKPWLEHHSACPNCMLEAHWVRYIDINGEQLRHEFFPVVPPPGHGIDAWYFGDANLLALQEIQEQNGFFTENANPFLMWD